MVAQRHEKLNHLQRTLPEGLVVDSAWLEANGYPKSLRFKYLGSGWLQRVVPGLYRRPSASVVPDRSDTDLTWEAVVASLQRLLGYDDMHVGGRTALELQGFAHFLPAATQREVHLYSARPLPSWLGKLPVAAWSLHTRSLFERDEALADDEEGKARQRASFDYGWKGARWPMRLSTPERASLELVDELPGKETFEQVDAMFSGLATLRPKVLQHLLERCRSVKAKRLFLFFAERHNHAWFKHLDLGRVDLGAGKRALVEHGRYDPKYRVTVPAFLLDLRNDL